VTLSPRLVPPAAAIRRLCVAGADPKERRGGIIFSHRFHSESTTLGEGFIDTECRDCEEYCEEVFGEQHCCRRRIVEERAACGIAEGFLSPTLDR